MVNALNSDNVMSVISVNSLAKQTIDLKVPAKIAVWFLETGRFLPVSIGVPWFLFLVLDAKKVLYLEV